MAKKDIYVTVLHPKEDLGANYVGQAVTMHLEPTEQDPYHINVKDLDGNVIGTVPKPMMTTALFATSFNKTVCDAYPGVKAFEGIVDSVGEVQENAKKRSALKVLVKGPISAKKMNEMTKELNVSFKTSTTYKGHKEAMALYQENNDIVVTLAKQDDNYLMFYKNEPFGTLNETPANGCAPVKDVMTYIDVVGPQEVTLKSLTTRSAIGVMAYDATLVEKGIAKQAIEGIQHIVDSIEAQGITTKENLREIYAYLLDNGVSPKHILNVFKTMRRYDAEDKALIPQKPPVLYKEDADALKEGTGLLNKSVVYINLGKHIRLEGPKGTGKNVLVRTLAWVYQRPLWEVSMNKQMGLSELFGDKTLETQSVDFEAPNFEACQSPEAMTKHYQETMANGMAALAKRESNVVFKPEGFIKAMEASTYGGFVLVDEINTSNPSLVAVLNAPLDDRRSVEVPGYKLVKGGENFCCISTMNAGYLGTTELNQALNDRFTPIVFKNNDSIIEMLKARCPGLDLEVYQEAERVFKEMKKLQEEDKLDEESLTVRGFIDAVQAAEDLGVKQALIDNVAYRIPDEAYRGAVINIIDLM